MHENPGIARRGRESILDFQPVIAIARIGDQMTARLTQAHQKTISNDERSRELRVGIYSRDVGMPAREVSSIEQTVRLSIQ